MRPPVWGQSQAAPPAAAEPEPPVVLPPGARCRMLALLWCLLSPVALWLLLRDRAWLAASGAGAAFRAVRLEQWIAVLLLLLHGWFLWRGRVRPNPATDLPPQPRAGGPADPPHH